MICNLGVVGSNPTRGSAKAKEEGTSEEVADEYDKGGYQSGQMGQTVNLLATPSVVRIHHHPLSSRRSGVLARFSKESFYWKRAEKPSTRK